MSPHQRRELRRATVSGLIAAPIGLALALAGLGLWGFFIAMILALVLAPPRLHRD